MTQPERADPRAEHRWPAILALLVALALHLALPSTFFPYVRYAVIVLGLVLLVPLVILNPTRLRRQTVWSKWFSTIQGLLIVAGNEIALVQLVILLSTAKHANGPVLLVAALQVWVMNIIAFALVFWEMDRGGPVTRRNARRPKLPPADFRFPQDEDQDTVTEVAVRSSVHSDWTASFFDYLYFSASSSMAFSPTDTMPLSIRAKALMVTEAASGFILLAVVIARAVSLLG